MSTIISPQAQAALKVAREALEHADRQTMKALGNYNVSEQCRDALSEARKGTTKASGLSIVEGNTTIILDALTKASHSLEHALTKTSSVIAVGQIVDAIVAIKEAGRLAIQADHLVA